MAQAKAPEFGQSVTSDGFLPGNVLSEHATITQLIDPLLSNARLLVQQHKAQTARTVFIAELLHS